MLLFILIIVFAVAADQLSKLLLYGKTLALIPKVVGVVRTSGLNTGAAWGLFGGKTGSVIALCCFSVITLAALVYVFVRYRGIMPKGIQIALAMICGGAVGNLIDRVILGGVRDFINFEFVEFPVFNVADIFVTCGGVLLGVALLFTKSGRAFAGEFFKEDKKQKPADPDTEAKA